MEYAIETEQLVKHYGKMTALDNLSIHVPVGKVYGFLGRNGSGKTTSIRIIMGLIRAEKGTVRIFGEDLKQNRERVMEKIGAIVETPGAYENLCAVDNLMIAARMHHVHKDRIKEVLQLVGLNDTGEKKVGKFSLGMRQRLGIAGALIHSPRIIILDEPTNGLDPEGILEMRQIIRNLAENYGISVLISSHLLSEMEQITDYVGMIHAGRVLQETRTDLLTEEQSYVLLETNEICKTEKVLHAMKLKFERERNAFRVFCSKSKNQEINSRLNQQSISVVNMASTAKTLEESFLSLTEAVSMKEEMV